MRALARVDKPDDTDQLQPLLGSDYISAKFSSRLRNIVNATPQYLGPFPYALDYLQAMWSDFDYWGNPKPRWQNEPPRKSYPAWAVDKAKQERDARWVGMEEIEPTGFSREDDVGQALRSRSVVGRAFRLYRSEATR